ncbi:MAG: Wadjet anti-phage system protein JetA family protein [Oceanobacter sp.]
MFFVNEREQFFRPLTGKYRHQVVACLTTLYQRMFSASNIDYGQSLSREQLLEVFQEVLEQAPDVWETDDSEASAGRFTNTREQAIWLMNLLIEHGWLEKQLDQATLHSSVNFSRSGRDFTEPFITSSRPLARTRHRNTRNTRNALEAFLERGDVYDLIDAYEYSERIITDFTDVIAELDERKRELVMEMEDQLLIQHAGEAFFDFMEKRFQPDLSVRLSADNVERHRDQIESLIRSIRKKSRTFKADTEKQLRALLPEQVEPGKSLLWWMLDGIEHRLGNAAEIMVPALRHALQGFTKRADIIIRQMGYLSSQKDNSVLDICRKLADLSPEQQAKALQSAGQHMQLPDIGFVDPEQVRLQPPRQRHIPESVLADSNSQPLDQDARKQQYIQRLLDQAFLINQDSLKQYFSQHLVQGNPVNSRDLPIESAADFLAVAHAIGMAAAGTGSEGFHIHIEPEQGSEERSQEPEDSCFQAKDHFIFQLVSDAVVTESESQ